MNFKQAWRVAGNPSPGNTSWSADVDGRPVFTAWRARDFGYDKQTRRSTFFAKPGDWIERPEGQSYLRRAKAARECSWVCRLIVLDGKDPWDHVDSADIDERLYAVRITDVVDDGTIRGELLTRDEFFSLEGPQ
jgi:hypothetical protein